MAAAFLSEIVRVAALAGGGLVAGGVVADLVRWCEVQLRGPEGGLSLGGGIRVHALTECVVAFLLENLSQCPHAKTSLPPAISSRRLPRHRSIDSALAGAGPGWRGGSKQQGAHGVHRGGGTGVTNPSRVRA